MGRIVVNVGRESTGFGYIGDPRCNNPVAVACARTFGAKGAFCTSYTVSLLFDGDVTYTRVYKLPGIVEAFLNPIPEKIVRIPFSFALDESARLW